MLSASEIYRLPRISLSICWVGVRAVQTPVILAPGPAPAVKTPGPARNF